MRRRRSDATGRNAEVLRPAERRKTDDELKTSYRGRLSGVVADGASDARRRAPSGRRRPAPGRRGARPTRRNTRRQCWRHLTRTSTRRDLSVAPHQSIYVEEYFGSAGPGLGHFAIYSFQFATPICTRLRHASSSPRRKMAKICTKSGWRGESRLCDLLGRSVDRGRLGEIRCSTGRPMPSGDTRPGWCR